MSQHQKLSLLTLFTKLKKLIIIKVLNTSYCQSQSVMVKSGPDPTVAQVFPSRLKLQVE